MSLKLVAVVVYFETKGREDAREEASRYLPPLVMTVWHLLGGNSALRRSISKWFGVKHDNIVTIVIYARWNRWWRNPVQCGKLR